MTSKIILLVLATIAAVAAVPHKALKRPNHDHIDYYDCTGKATGNHVHPTDCTRFISCSAGGVASDMACPDCNQHDEKCAGEPFLRWSAATGNCEWPADTECSTDGDDSSGDSDCEGIAVDGDCDKDTCEHCGFCKDKMSHFYRCNRTFPSDPKLEITGKWVLESCDSDLWWNPDLKPEGVAVGGACDKWDNLSPETQKKYKDDKSCVDIPPVCAWGQDEADKCSERYWYLDPATMSEKENLSCPSGLLWDQATETCRSCANIDACEC